MVEEECETCLYGVIIGVADNLCKITQDKETVEKCEIMKDDVILGKTTVREYMNNIKSIVSNDAQASFTINESMKILDEKGI